MPGPAKDKIDAAVLEWVEGATPEDIATGEKISESRFSKAKSLPPSTFHKHVANYKESWGPLPSVPDRAAAVKAAAKRRRRGKPALISYEKQGFISEVIVRADRANEGMTSLAIFDMIEALFPELKHKQIRDAFKNLKRSKRNRGRLTSTVKAQKSTTKRSAITVEQQFRWHQVGIGELA